MPISEISINADYIGFAIVNFAEAKTTAAGKPYVAYTLRDRSGTIRTNHWDATAPIPVGSLVKFAGKGELYNGALQFKLDPKRFRLAEDRDGISIEDVLPAAPEPVDAMMVEIRATVSAFADADLKALVTALLDASAGTMLRFPAAQAMHHAEIGGLLHHVTSMLRAAKALVGVYPDLRADLLYAGVIVHDLGKLEEMERDASGLVSGYTVPGKLLGHIHLGAVRIAETAAAIGTPPETSLLLQHMVLAHHGCPEWGSPIPARFPEAEVLSTLDLLDARLFEMREALAHVAPGEFSERVIALDRRELYQPK